MDLKSDASAGGLSRGYRFGVGVNVFAICVLATVLAVGAVVVVRQLSYRFDLRFDTTHDSRYSLDPLTKQILRAVEAPVQIDFCWGFDQDILHRVLDNQGRPRSDLLGRYYRPILQRAQVQVRQVLQEWEKATPHLELRILDLERAPLAVEEMARDQGRGLEELVNRVVFRYGGRRVEVPLRRMMEGMEWGYFHPSGQQSEPSDVPRTWRVREELVAALRAITQGEQIPIGVLKGWRGRIEPGSSEFLAVAHVLEGEGYELVPIGPEEEIPERCRAVVVGGPRVPMGPRMAARLSEYERRGGRLLMVVPPLSNPGIEGVVEAFGVGWPSAVIAADPHNQPPHLTPGLLESDDLFTEGHPIVAPLYRRVTLHLGRARPLQLRPERAPGVERVTLLKASSLAQQDPVQDRPDGAGRVVEGQRDRASEAVLAVAMARALDGKRQSRVVLIGSDDFIRRDILLQGARYANRDFLANALAWLTDRETSIGLVPRTQREDRYINPNRLAGPLVAVGVIGLPLLAAAMGILVFLARRN